MDFRTKSLGILAMAILMILSSVSFFKVYADGSKRQVYMQSLNQLISSCNSKATLADSRSANIRSYCELARLKAEFMIKHKELLIEGMSQIKLTPSAYKIQLFVNSKFFEKRRSAVQLSGP